MISLLALLVAAVALFQAFRARRSLRRFRRCDRSHCAGLIDARIKASEQWARVRDDELLGDTSELLATFQRMTPTDQLEVLAAIEHLYPVEVGKVAEVVAARLGKGKQAVS